MIVILTLVTACVCLLADGQRIGIPTPPDPCAKFIFADQNNDTVVYEYMPECEERKLRWEYAYGGLFCDVRGPSKGFKLCFTNGEMLKGFVIREDGTEEAVPIPNRNQQPGEANCRMTSSGTMRLYFTPPVRPYIGWALWSIQA